MKTYGTLLAVVVLFGVQAPAQQFPPGFVDPAPLLAAAAREIGEANFKCVTFSGTGYGGAVGQTFEHAVNVDWPRIDALANYTRTINWETGTSKETFDRKPGLNPASWKYGLGWVDGTPAQKNLRQTHLTNGKYSWSNDGDAPPVAARPEDAERYQLDLWMNPPGFIKAARLPGANPRAFWRWEQIEKGRDGNVVAPEKIHVVAITVLGKYRMDATINSRNQIQRIKTTVAENAMGDFNIEHESTDQVSVGGVKWPTVWHSHQGWDDNWQFYSKSTGHNAYGGRFPKVQPNVCADPVSVPASVMQAQFTNTVTVDRLGTGVYMLGGGPANSYMIEFDTFVAVFEAPGSEERSLAVIEQIVKLAPEQANPLVDQLAPPFRSHRRDSQLQPHRRDRRHALLERRLHESRHPHVYAEDDEARHPVAVAADRSGGRVQLRGGAGELRHHRQHSHLARVLRAASGARVGNAHGVPAGGAHRVRGGSLRYPRSAHRPPEAGDDQLLEPGEAHEAERVHDRTCARTSGAVVRFREGDG